MANDPQNEKGASPRVYQAPAPSGDTAQAVELDIEPPTFKEQFLQHDPVFQRRRNRPRLIDLALLVFVLLVGVTWFMIGFAQVGQYAPPPPQPTVTPISGWRKFSALDAVEIWLPQSYVGGDMQLGRRELLQRSMSLGVERSRMVAELDAIEADGAIMVMMDFDMSALGTTVTIGAEAATTASSLDDAADVLSRELQHESGPSSRLVERSHVALERYQALRITHEFLQNQLQIRQLIYVVKQGRTIWAVAFSADAGGFAALQPTFERSMSSFSILP